jgi:hypothetical protein
MTVPARFMEGYPDYPVVIGYLWHVSLPRERELDFIVDTGADRTYVGADGRFSLQIPKRHFVPYASELTTIAGPAKVDHLEQCRLRFDRVDSNGQRIGEYIFRDVSLSFSRATIWGGSRIPNLLGRDLLSKLALGYCYNPRHVFLTQRCHDFSNLLAPHFYRP